MDFARRLDVKNVPLHQLSIQFVQIGDDPGATEALKELDDQLGPDHGVRVSNCNKSFTLINLMGLLIRTWWIRSPSVKQSRPSAQILSSKSCSVQLIPGSPMEGPRHLCLIIRKVVTIKGSRMWKNRLSRIDKRCCKSVSGNMFSSCIFRMLEYRDQLRRSTV